MTRVLGADPVWKAARAAIAAPLRIVAYHDVSDAAAFERQLAFLSTAYNPVSGETVVAWLRDGVALPKHALWITFDDGARDTVDVALPILVRHGVPATLFVCPGLVADAEPFWWDVVAAAESAGWTPAAFERAGDVPIVTMLKREPDRLRRRVVAEARHALDAAGVVVQPGIDEERLRRWMDAGYEIGNHTWDHPCFVACDPVEQARQVRAADAWLQERGAFERVRLFAYANGDWTPDIERVLAQERYDAALLFDHRVVAREPQRFRLSRLRLDADAPVARVRAIVSGSHSLVVHSRHPLLAWRARRVQRASLSSWTGETSAT